ncbi:hypothetical protein [Haloferula rosea]|uniref:Uncharacterized protein n=1 Tax=Haloferula rosea TaxID=490093 RepID=A0A934RC16_9BACT|nr:hypothetical protein [Haloferula rosea]MBK1828869.1 hypothetical protein [Haloferula rosea]
MIQPLLTRVRHWTLTTLYQSQVITHLGDLPVVSLRTEHADFLRIIRLSFELIETLDPRRAARVIHHTRWIVEASLALGPRSGRYCPQLSVIELDFDYDPDFGDDLRHAAYFAGVLVHEATHGLLAHKGFHYTTDQRVQIERICVAEENRFLLKTNRLREGLGDNLQFKFDPCLWEDAWQMGRWEKFTRSLKRSWSASSGEPAAN